MGRERGRKGGEFFVCFLFLFLGRRASAFGELGRKQGECERYELKIDYITMDQECTWSQYMVNILLWISIFIYILCIDTR